MKNFLSRIFANTNQMIVWGIAAIVITAVSMFTSYQPLWGNVPINVIIPIVVLISLKPVFFERLKLSTLILIRALIAVVVLGFMDGTLYVKIVLAFLIINILEATFTDLKYKKYYNFVTGLALAASVLVLKGTWLGNFYVADAATAFGTICWIIAYTIWNWIFVTDEFSPSIAWLHIGILAAPILGCLLVWTPGMWLIFRANSLTFGGVLQIVNKEFFEEKLENEKFTKFVLATQKNSVQLVLMVINLVLLGITAAVMFI